MGFIAVTGEWIAWTVGRFCGLFLLCTVSSHGTEASAVTLCQHHELTVSAGPVQSRWQEHDQSGEILLTERGLLMKNVAGWRTTCGLWALQLEGSRVSGHRLYKGVTNLRQPVDTISEIRSHELDAQAWHSFAQAWALGARYLWQTVDRDLKTIGSVMGYRERYKQTALAFGLQHMQDWTTHGQLKSHIWMGTGLQGHLDVTLPGMDTATLPLGRLHYWAAGVQWSGCRTGANEAGWFCEMALDFQSERSSQGATQAIYRNGDLRASARQPATRHQSLTFKLGAHYRFN